MSVVTWDELVANRRTVRDASMLLVSALVDVEWRMEEELCGERWWTESMGGSWSVGTPLAVGRAVSM